ncbi:MAG TPA: TonB family protein [Gemmatimonadaceae bacterium]
MVAGATAACASGTVRVYDPPQTAARISIIDMRTRLAEMMVVECPRLLGSRDQRRGAVTIGLALDSSGRVEHASIRRGSGDATFDDLAGGLAARLTLAPDPTVLASYPAPRSLTVLYECAPTAADVRVQIDSV